MRKAFGFIRRLAWGTIGTILVIATALGLGTIVPRPFSLAGVRPGASLGGERTEGQTILLLSNPIHTDIALPMTDAVLQTFGFVSDNGLGLDYPGVEWLVVGWGGEAFYTQTPTWTDVKLGPVLSSLTLDRSVMHVERAGVIRPTQPSVREIRLDGPGFNRLLVEIRKSFRGLSALEPKPLEVPPYGAHDVFYPAVGGFNVLMGCNTWTAAMLRSAGVTTGVWTPLPLFLNWSLDLYSNDQFGA
ncbi:TIGR02117 family protein [Roseibium sp. CAU 1637]|uniref:TIGR02117 family protein n=1 Tax=Roseibium limicola TaxID=2816037 RepID=A0A939J8R3_9HYPH|nr:TIGR02117 family protein [Roseibium limicola]MBO0344618.1 TIGR02117 family protein [Roseibium limicola]